MSVSDASFGQHNYQAGHWPCRKRWVGTVVAVAACLAMVDRYGRSDDAKGEPKPGTVITNTIGIKLAWIPAGEFLMGTHSDEEARDDDGEQHRVRITKPFHFGVCEVTQREWAVVMGTTPWTGKGYVREGDRYPATYVSWEDATEFCRKLTDKERAAGRLDPGESCRLPTEAEWEYACRAGSTTRYHFGNGEGSLGEYAWYKKSAWDINEKYAHAVGLKRANAWGLFDMHGNVTEWCSDRYADRYYRESPLADPQGPSEVWDRVNRGGSWNSDASNCRSALRFRVGPLDQDFSLGFRVARTIAPSE